MSPTIGHLDCDCFYVSAERIRHPHLRGVPVVVLGNQGACCIAKSYEAKAAGIKTGTAIWDAIAMCPDVVAVKRDFAWYEVLSRRLLELVRSESPEVEYYSIDEMFFSAERVDAGTIKQRIWDELGLSVSIGIAPSRSLAKLASDVHKPGGVKVLDSPTEIEELLRRLPVNELCGIAKASVARLKPHGIRNCWEFAQADPVLIRKLLTVKGEGILWELRGQSIIPLNTERPAHKAISRGGSMGETTVDPGRLRAWIVRHSERLVDELDYHYVLAGQLSVNLAFKHEDGITARVRLQTPQSAFAEISRAALEAFERELLPRIRPTTHVHLIADQLVLRRAFQRGLFDEPGSTQLDDLRRAINKKLGIASVRSAATLALNGVYDDPLALYDVCDIRGKQCF